MGISTHFEVYVIFNLDFGKKYRGLSICAKILIFVIVTLDRLFQKSGASFFLISIKLVVSGCQSCRKCQRMPKNDILTLKVPKQSKNQIIQNLCTNFLRENMKILRAKFQTVSSICVACVFFSSNFFKHLFVQFDPLNSLLCL